MEEENRIWHSRPRALARPAAAVSGGPRMGCFFFLPVFSLTATASCVNLSGDWPWSHARRRSSTCLWRGGRGRGGAVRACGWRGGGERGRNKIIEVSNAFAAWPSRRAPRAARPTAAPPFSAPGSSASHLARIRRRVQEARHAQALEGEPAEGVTEDRGWRAAARGKRVLAREGERVVCACEGAWPAAVQAT